MSHLPHWLRTPTCCSWLVSVCAWHGLAVSLLAEWSHPVLVTSLLLAAGVLPFGTIFIELYFSLTSVWLGYFYYLFGFAFVIGLLTMVITAEIAVLCTYVQLCAEDHNWW